VFALLPLQVNEYNNLRQKLPFETEHAQLLLQRTKLHVRTAEGSKGWLMSMYNERAMCKHNRLAQKQKGT
jgi:hypothetical protein